MSNYTFIKDPDILEEDYRVNDLLDFSTNINGLTEQLIRIKSNSMVGLVGPYGCGKSTLLYQLYREYPDKKNNCGNKKVNATNLEEVRNAKWFTFDAWQYPERKDLWDGFIIELARSMSDKCLKEIKKEIDGNQNSKAKTTAKVVAAAVNIPILSNITGAMKEVLLGILSSPPLKRVFEFQELLKKMINKIDKDIYIVIEDIDRSGDKGIFFLETLSHFIKSINSEHNETDSKHKIIVIVPMGDEIFKEQGNRDAKSSYLKILDYQVKFNPQDIDCAKFIKSVIDISKDYRRNSSEYISKFLSQVILASEGGTIRDIKHLIRRADQNYNLLKDSDDESIDIFFVLLFTATEYFHVKNGKEEIYYLESIPDSEHYAGEIKHRQLIMMPIDHWLYKSLLAYFEVIPLKAIADKYYEHGNEEFSPILLNFNDTPHEPDATHGDHVYGIVRDKSNKNILIVNIILNKKHFELIPHELIQVVDKNKYSDS